MSETPPRSAPEFDGPPGGAFLTTDEVAALLGRKPEAKLEFLLLGEDRLLHRLTAEVWREYQIRG